MYRQLFRVPGTITKSVLPDQTITLPPLYAVVSSRCRSLCDTKLGYDHRSFEVKNVTRQKKELATIVSIYRGAYKTAVSALCAVGKADFLAGFLKLKPPDLIRFVTVWIEHLGFFCVLSFSKNQDLRQSFVFQQSPQLAIFELNRDFRSPDLSSFLQNQ